jgi:hypothetical protein
MPDGRISPNGFDAISSHTIGRVKTPTVLAMARQQRCPLELQGVIRCCQS